MKMSMGQKVLSVAVTTALTVSMLAGCGSASEQTAEVDQAVVEETIAEEPVAKADTAETNNATAPYLTKGVYANYSAELENPSKDYFYVFSDESYGYTDDARSGVGLPFDCEQEAGAITFWFGGS